MKTSYVKIYHSEPSYKKKINMSLRSKEIHWERKSSLFISGNHFSIHDRQPSASKRLQILWITLRNTPFCIKLAYIPYLVNRRS